MGSNAEGAVRSQLPTSRCDSSSPSLERPTMVSSPVVPAVRLSSSYPLISMPHTVSTVNATLLQASGGTIDVWPTSTSGNIAKQKSFQNKLLNFSSHPGDKSPPNLTTHSFTSGSTGVLNRIEIPFRGQLHPKIFLKINQIWGPLTVDLFASRLAHQLPAYFSWRPDSQASATDASLQDWSGKIYFANPPWGLILKALSEISHQQADNNSSPSLERPTMVSSSVVPAVQISSSSACPILSQQSMPPPSSLRKYNWPYGPPQGILPNRKVFRTSF